MTDDYLSDINDPKRYYRGNKNLLNPNVTHQYTEDEVQEVIKCANDPIYFIEKYVKIINVDRGLIPFILYPYQKKLIRSIHNNRNTIALQVRQSGKTQTCVSYYLWCAIFIPNYKIALLANKAMIAKELLDRLQNSLEFLPTFLKPGIKSFNVFDLELANGSKVIAAATSGSAIRGLSLNMLHMDEFSHIEDHLADEFFASVVPTISSGKNTKMVIVSTANGYNKFYEIWKKAVDGKNGFNPIRVDWWEVPGRDEKWKDEMIAVQGPRKFAQEFGNDFLGSSNTLIDPVYISSMADDDPIQWSDTLKVYKDAEPRHAYLLVCDPSEGLGQDYSAAIVYDITTYPIRIVAVYKDNKVSPLVLPTILERLGKKYGDAAILVESNNMGMNIISNLHYEMEYPHVISFGWNSGKFGVKTTKTTKRIGCNFLKSMVEEKKFVVNDLELISEISTFTQQKNTYKAEVGKHDDLVMTAVLMAWFTTTDEFKQLTDTDLRLEILRQKEEMIEHDILPVGWSGYDDEMERADTMKMLMAEGFFFHEPPKG